MLEALRRGPLAHVLVVLAVSAAYESLFLYHGINVVDEGWPLYAAMRLQHGGVLYRDVFFVFPPGHLASAWLAYALDPPGLVTARMLYAAWSVALSGVVYLLGRRITTPGAALFGALLLAVAATPSHMQQLVFGYRYLVLSALALLCFATRLRGGSEGWTFGAGMLAGLALAFRLTPAFAVSVGIAVGIVAAGGGPRRWLREWALYGAGLLLVVGPIVAWFAATVGLDTLWLEVVVRPVAMTNQQSLPVPELGAFPFHGSRRQISDWWVALQFRAWIAMYLAYALGLAWSGWRAFREGRAHSQPLLVAVVVWGGVYFVRSLGRSDSAHLYSAIPPVCLLLGHAAGLVARAGLWRRTGRGPRIAAAALAMAMWVFLTGGDRALDPAYRGDHLLDIPGTPVYLRPRSRLNAVAPKVRTIRRLTREGQTILDLSASSLFHPLSGRLGPGYADVVMPGTFLNDAEERAFVRRLRRHPPALVIFPGNSFDGLSERSVERFAPRVARWVRRHYEPMGPLGRFTLMRPKPAPGAPSRLPAQRRARPRSASGR